MTGSALPNLGLQSGWAAHESGWGVGGLNPNMELLDAITFLSVTSDAVATPPGSPTTGDRYIVAASPTDAWTGHAKDLAIYRNSAWNFYTPKLGWRAWNAAGSTYIRFNGTSWIVDAGTVSALDDLTDVTIVSPADDQVLTYDSATDQWKNKTPSGASGLTGCAAFIAANPPPDLSTWTQTNISSPATAADSSAGPVITTQADTGYSARILWRTLPAAPQGFTADFLLALDWVGGQQSAPAGILLGRASDSNFRAFGVRFDSGFPEMGNYEYDSFTPSDVSAGDRAPCFPNFSMLAFRLKRTGTSYTTYFYHSADCVNWQPFSQSDYGIYAANRIGFFIDMGTGSTGGGGPTLTSQITLLGYRYELDP